MISMSLYIYYINFHYKWTIVKFRTSCRTITPGLNMAIWEREKLIRGRHTNKIVYLYKFFRISDLISFCLKSYFTKLIKTLLSLYHVSVSPHILEPRKHKIFETLLNITTCSIKLILSNLIICCMSIMVYVMCYINKVKLYM